MYEVSRDVEREYISCHDLMKTVHCHSAVRDTDRSDDAFDQLENERERHLLRDEQVATRRESTFPNDQPEKFVRDHKNLLVVRERVRCFRSLKRICTDITEEDVQHKMLTRYVTHLLNAAG